MGWVNQMGGIVAVVVAVLLCINVLLSAASSILGALHVNAPGWLGKVAGWAKTVTDWISANVQHK